MTEDTLPTGWREIDDTDQDAGRYNPQPIGRYEHESGVGLRLTPSDPTVETASSGEVESEPEDEYRVGVGLDGVDDPADMHVLASASDHAGALGVAREFMQTYNDRCVDGEEGAETVVSEFANEN
jgi:hypothetical protein